MTVLSSDVSEMYTMYKVQVGSEPVSDLLDFYEVQNLLPSALNRHETFTVVPVTVQRTTTITLVP